MTPERFVEIAAALSLMTRYKILEFLSKASPSQSGLVADSIGLIQQRFSEQAKLLVLAGLVKKVRLGRFVYYRLNEEELVEFAKHVTEVLLKGGKVETGRVETGTAEGADVR